MANETLLTDEGATRPVSRSILHKSRGTRRGPLTGIFGPSNLGEQLKPFVLLDHLEKGEGERLGFGLHPHSGIATLTYVAEGAGSYVDPSGETGFLTDGSLEYMKAGRGMWHATGPEAGALLGIQLWIALPPELELTPYESSYIPAESIQTDGPARVLLGALGDARSPVNLDLPINYFAVTLRTGEQWTYLPPASHRVLWLSVARGELASSEPIGAGELAIFDDSEGGITVEAISDTILVVGSAVPHAHDLVRGRHSVHTNQSALAEGESNIEQLAVGLRQDGRL